MIHQKVQSRETTKRLWKVNYACAVDEPVTNISLQNKVVIISVISSISVFYYFDIVQRSTNRKLWKLLRKHSRRQGKM